MKSTGAQILRVIDEANAVELPDPELAGKLWEKLSSRLAEDTPEGLPNEGPLPASHAVRDAAGLLARKWLVRGITCSVLVGGGAVLWAHQPRLPAAIIERAPVEQPSAATLSEAVLPARTLSAPAGIGSLGDLSEETRLLGEAQRALNQGAPERSLRWLQQHTERFPTGVLAHERDAARVFALCALGRQSEARKERQRFTRTWPDSPLGTLVRSGCVESRPNTKPKPSAAHAPGDKRSGR